MEVLDHLLEHLLVRTARDEAHRLHRLDDASRIARQRALDQLDDAGADGGGDLGDRAEIEERDRRRAGVVGADEEIPGVRIGVIDAVGEDLLAVELDDLTGEMPAVDLELLRGDLVGDLEAGLEVGDQHAVGRQLLDDRRERDVRAAHEVRGDPRRVARLGLVVELLHHDRADLAIQLVEPLVRHEPLDDVEDPAQRVEVAADDLLDVGVLHLDRDLGAVDQAREVDLPDRGRGERALVELREHLLGAATVLLDQPLLDVLVRARRHRVLQPLELAAELLGKEVRHDRDQLPDLDEQALELDDRALDPARVAEVDLAELVLGPRVGMPARAEAEPEVAPDHDPRRPVRAPAAHAKGRAAAHPIVAVVPLHRGQRVDGVGRAMQAR